MLGDFNAKLGRGYFQPTAGNEILHREINDSSVRIVNFATSENLFFNSTMFLHRNILK